MPQTLPPLPVMLRPSQVKTTDCLIDVRLAAIIRDKALTIGLKPGPNGDFGFRCPECNKPVKPHVGSGVPVHFEHLTHNPNCSLSPGQR